MKKIIIAAMLAAVALTSCGTTYKKVHIDTEHFSGCFNIESVATTFFEPEGIKVITEEYGTMVLSEGTYILLEKDKKCPLCTDKILDWKDFL